MDSTTYLEDITKSLENAVAIAMENTDGLVADYIPELKKS